MVLINTARAYGTMVGDVITLESIYPLHFPFKEAIESEVGVGNADGETIQIRIENKISSLYPDFTLCDATFNTSPDRLTRTTTLMSKKGATYGNAEVVHETDVIVGGIVMAKNIHPTDQRELQSGVETSFGTLQSDSASTTLEDCGTAVFDVTPILSTSSLEVTFYVGGYVERTSSGNNLRMLSRLYYENSGGIWTASGVEVQMGLQSAPSDADQRFRGVLSSPVVLSSSLQNAAGDWSIIPRTRCGDADCQYTVDNCRVRYREIL